MTYCARQQRNILQFINRFILISILLVVSQKFLLQDSDFFHIGPAIIITILGFIVAYQFVDPAPPRHIRIATGSPE